LTNRCIEEVKQLPDSEPGKALSTKLNRLSEIEAVSLFEEPDAGKPHVRFCEGPGPTGVWLKYRGTAGKPGGKRRKQTSTYSIGRNGSTRLNSTNQLNEVEVHRFRGQIVVKNRTSLDSKRIVSYQPAEEVLVRLHVFVFFQYVRVA